MVELLGLSIHKPLTLCFFFHYGMTTYSFLSFSPSITSPFYPSLHVQICPIGVSTGWIPSCTCCPVWILMGTTAECCCLPIATWDTPLLSLFFRYRRITNINVKIGVCGSWKKKKFPISWVKKPEKANPLLDVESVDEIHWKAGWRWRGCNVISGKSFCHSSFCCAHCENEKKRGGIHHV